MYRVVFTKQAEKEKKLIKQVGYEKKAKELLNILTKDPFTTPPEYKRSLGNLSEFYSRRINLQHRLVYQVYENEKVVKVVSMWSHYERL